MKVRLGTVAVGFAAAAAAVSLHAQAPADHLHRFYSAYWEDELRFSPQLATDTGRTEYNDRWNDWSKAGRQALHASRMRYLSEVDTFQSGSLSPADRLNRDLLRYQLRAALEDEQDNDYLLAAGHMWGLHLRVYETVSRMPARTIEDYENIIARLEAIPSYIGQTMEMLQEAIDRGIVQPAAIVELVQNQLDAEIRQDVQQTPLLEAFRAFPAAVGAAEQTRLVQRAEATYNEKFLPAWQKYRAFFASTYASRARADVGVGAIPDGRRVYSSMVRRSTTTGMTPDEIHKLGLEEVGRIERAMQSVLVEVGFKGTIQEFEEMLRTRPDMTFRTSEEMLVFARNIAMIVQPQLPRLFKRLPRSPFGILAVPEDRESGGSTYYESPATDGTRAGFVRLNTYHPETQVKYDKEALILHEGVPGHHLQIGLSVEAEGVPEFRKYIDATAYVEGWGLYAESLGDELGLYRDPYSRFGRLTSERVRAARLVVDTGLHAFGWSRNQAVDYFRLHAPTTSVAQIDRYISMPAQALAYKVGELKILELRKRAEGALGSHFDIRDFHDILLQNGRLPLELLEQQVDDYIRKNEQTGSPLH
jgi:prolyl oligopeptidase